MEHSLQTGTLTITYKDGMYRTFVNGRNYIAEDEQSLLQSLSHYHPVVTPEPPKPVDMRTEAEILVDTLTDPKTGLALRQYCIARIFDYDGEKNKHADKLLRKFKKKPKLSREAANLTKQLSKADFCLVTHEELVENVNNLVLRSKLMDELSERLRF